MHWIYSSFIQRILALITWVSYVTYQSRYDFFPWLFGKAWFLLVPVGIIWYSEKIASAFPIPAFVMKKNPLAAQQKLTLSIRTLGWILLLIPWVKLG